VIGYVGWRLVDILGSAAQVQHACDSGTLNLARTALVTPQVPLNNPNMIQKDPTWIIGNQLPYSDFFACIAPYSGINLANINKILGQALIVADTAATEGTTLAGQHAVEVYWAATNDATYLRYLLSPQGLIQSNTNSSLVAAYEGSFASPTQSMPAPGANSALENAFTDLGQQNPMSMLGCSSQSIAINGESVAWMDQGGSCSIWVDKNTVSKTTYDNLPLNTTSPLKPVLNYTPASPYQPSYIKGYTKVPLDILGTNLSLGFVTDRPQQTTSLASLTDFNANTTPILGFDPSGVITGATNLAYLPPNAFKATCTAQGNAGSSTSNNTSSSKTQGSKNNNNEPVAGNGGQQNLVISTLACAEIGAINNGYVACIPGGYIRVDNLAPAAASTAANTVVYDATETDIFDDMAAAPKAIWTSPPVSCPTLGGAQACLFSQNMDDLYSWIDFCKTARKDAKTGYELVNNQYYDKAKDPLAANKDLCSNHNQTDVVDTNIKIAASNYTAALQDLLALEEIKDKHNYTLDGDKCGITKKSELLTCLGVTGETQAQQDAAFSKYVSGTTINSKELFAIIDETIDGKEPSYVDQALSYIEDCLTPAGKGQLSANALFPDGLDVVAKVKFDLMSARNAMNHSKLNSQSGNLEYKLNLTLTDKKIDHGKPVNVMLSGMLYIPNMFAKSNPFPSTAKIPNNPSSYITHQALMLNHTTGQLGTAQYAWSPTPAQALATIDEALNGPLQEDLTHLNNGQANASGDHSFDPSQAGFQTFVTTLWRQCLKIKPSCSLNEMLQALGFAVDLAGNVSLPSSSTVPTIAPGSSVYLHVSPTTGNLTCDSSLPYASQSEQPDGTAGNPYYTGFFMVAGSNGGHTFDSSQFNSLINTSVDNVTDTYASDDTYHLVMWEKQTNVLQIQNEAIFTPSCGYHNLLGVVSIDTSLKDAADSGVVTFDNPN
jgi:hypothetical protein